MRSPSPFIHIGAAPPAAAAVTLALALASGCSREEAPRPSPPAPSASAAASAEQPASEQIEGARSRGEYKARMGLHIADLDARIKELDARAGAPGGERLKPQVEAVREARWRVDRAQKAVQTAGDDEWKQATAEYEAADRDLTEKLDKALGGSKR